MRHGGDVFKHTGDGVLCRVHLGARAAVSAAVEAQAASSACRCGWGSTPARPRRATATTSGPRSTAPLRVMDAGHGGQVLISASTAGLVRRAWRSIDLGEHDVKGLDTPERIYQVGHGSFPPLRTARERVGKPAGRAVDVHRSEQRDLRPRRADWPSHRLVTLIGVGGTGKTRLALETCAAVAEAFPRRVLDHRARRRQRRRGRAVRRSPTDCGLTPPPDRRRDSSDLAPRLRHKRLLLVVDNCEHVLP